MTIAEAKQSLRKEIKQALSVYPPASLSHLSEESMRILENDAVFQSASVILLYHSLPDEVGTHAFINRWYQHKTLLLPRVEGDHLTLHPYTGPECLAEGKWGILEPFGPMFTDYPLLELAVVPGMAFDLSGHRLGRGKGYYDRLLTIKQMSHVHRIGIAYPFQIVEAVPFEDHDIVMNTIITANGAVLASRQ